MNRIICFLGVLNTMVYKSYTCNALCENVSEHALVPT